MHRVAILVAILLLCSCARNEFGVRPAQAGESLGLSLADAIEVCDPDGERAYLSRLVCPNGKRPTFSRDGSVGDRNPVPADMSEDEQMEFLQDAMSRRELGAGDVDYHIVDAYSVVCEGEAVTIYMDMYHCVRPPTDNAPRGFTTLD